MFIRAEILRLVDELPGLAVLDEGAASDVLRRFVERYVVDERQRCWWNSLRPELERQSHAYGSEEAWDTIAELVPERTTYLLVVTDDDQDPPLVVSGSFRALCDLVGEAFYFEYLVTDPDVSFGVFDTHHNVLVSATPGPARP